MFAEKAKHFRWTAFLIVILGFGVLFAGCGEDESDDIPSGPAEEVGTLISDGWAAFNDGMIDDALDYFTRAANAEASNLEAYLGMGYSFSENNELDRAHQSFGNVIALSVVLLGSGDITQATADTLLAETYAGKAAAYLAGGDYTDAVESGNMAIDLWEGFANPKHRWIPGYDLDDLKLVVANAHYNNTDYNQAVIIVHELSGNTFISEAEHLFRTQETLNPTLLESTWQTGIANLIITENEYLVNPVSIEDEDGISCTILDFDMAGTTVEFMGNPIPQETLEYTVDYYYADDFGEFLMELRNTMDELEG